MREVVVITGGTGFIGRYILDEIIHRKKEVHVLTRKKPAFVDELYGKSIIWHEVDLYNCILVKRYLREISPTHLLHGAWDVTGDSYWESEENLACLSASIFLMKTFVECGGKRIVGVGTCAEYSWNNEHLKEDTSLCVPKTLYGFCKLSFSRILHFYCKKHNVSTAWGRLFYIYGPNEAAEKLISSSLRSLYNNQLINCRSGERIVDYLYVKDAARAFDRLLFSLVEGDINIASGHAIKVSEMLELLCRKVGKKGQIDFLQARAKNLNIIADVSRLKSELNFYPEYTLEKGFEEMIAWRNNNEM